MGKGVLISLECLSSELVLVYIVAHESLGPHDKQLLSAWTTSTPIVYENKAALRKVFEKYGEVADVLVQRDTDTCLKTSSYIRTNKTPPFLPSPHASWTRLAAGCSYLPAAPPPPSHAWSAPGVAIRRVRVGAGSPSIWAAAHRAAVHVENDTFSFMRPDQSYRYRRGKCTHSTGKVRRSTDSQICCRSK